MGKQEGKNQNKNTSFPIRPYIWAATERCSLHTGQTHLLRYCRQETPAGFSDQQLGMCSADVPTGLPRVILDPAKLAI